MKKLEKIWNFLNSRLVGYALLLILVIFLIGTCQRYFSAQDEIERRGNNIEAMADIIRNERLKNGELQASIRGYIADLDELKIYNKELANQLEKEKGRIITLNNIVFRLRQDTTDLKNYIDSLLTVMKTPVKENDSTWYIDWTIAYTYDEYNYDRYSGRTRIGLRGSEEFLDDVIIFNRGTSLLNRDSQIRITWGQKYENGGVRVFARTAHPAFEAQLLEGVYVDYPEKRNWFNGFGIGPSLNIGWDFVNSRPAIIIGGGIHYNIYQW